MVHCLEQIIKQNNEAIKLHNDSKLVIAIAFKQYENILFWADERRKYLGQDITKLDQENIVKSVELARNKLIKVIKESK